MGGAPASLANELVISLFSFPLHLTFLFFPDNARYAKVLKILSPLKTFIIRDGFITFFNDSTEMSFMNDNVLLIVVLSFLFSIC